MKDNFGREITYLRLSVTDKCNLRCRYCMPEEGVPCRSHAEMLTEDEMVSAVEAAAKLGIRLEEEKGHAYLTEMNGHPAVTMDFANLYELFKRIKNEEVTA